LRGVDSLHHARFEAQLPFNNPLGAVAQVRGIDPELLVTAVPPLRTLEERVLMATRCRDTDVLSKTLDAGKVVTRADGKRVQIMHNGIEVIAGGYYGDWMMDLIERCRGHHEPQEEVAFAEVLRHLSPEGTMIELGGYWSFYSIWFVKDHPRRRGYVVEPDPAHIDVGRANAELNQSSLHFTNAFVGPDPVAAAPFATEKSGVITLPCVSITSLMDANNIDHLDLLHCDTQGAELSVLESCRELGKQGRIGWVVVSTHAHSISGDPLTHQRCLASLSRSGAKILCEHDVQESYSGDGLIVATFREVPEGWRPPTISYNRASESLFRNPLYDLAAAVKGDG
jgi:FkbM family methyltransferase